MGKSGDSLLDRAVFHRTVRQWGRAAQVSESTSPDLLRDQARRARLLRAQLDRLIHSADDRLAPPGSRAPIRPHNSDWNWRPEAWRDHFDRPGLPHAGSGAHFGTDTRLFHDCGRNEVVLRQLRNSPEAGRAPFGVSLDVYWFGGSFLSIALELPSNALEGLRREHLLRLDCSLAFERPEPVYARLNLRQGPNSEQLLLQLPFGVAPCTIEFDLGRSQTDPARVEQAWVDLIFENPAMNQVVISDLQLSRRLRAET